jgi:hypothetical protein
MSIAKLRKGGRSRFVISGAVSGDSFTVPAGQRISSLMVENVSGHQLQAIPISGVQGGTITVFTINGVDFIGSSIANADTAVAVAGKIMGNQTALKALAKTGWSAWYNPLVATVYLYGNFSTVQSAVAIVSTGGVTQTIGGSATAGTATIRSVPTLSFNTTLSNTPVQTLTISGTLTANGTALTIAGATFMTAASNGAGIVSGDSVSTIVTKILAYTPGIQELLGLGLVLTGNASTGVLTLTGTYTRVLSAQSNTVTGFTGLTFATTWTQVVAGTAAANDLLTAGNLSVAQRNVSETLPASLTGPSLSYVPASNVSSYLYTFSGSSSTAGTIYINGNVYTIGTQASLALFVTAVSNLSIPGFVLTTNGSTTVTATQIAGGTGWDQPTIVIGTITGITYTLTTVTPKDRVVYLNFTVSNTSGTPNGGYPAQGAGQFNVYAMLDKFN